MYYIHAIGAAIAPTQIDSQFLAQLAGANKTQSAGVLNRFSILRRDYLQATGNQDLAQARTNCELSVAELAANAAREAFSGIDEELAAADLLIADTATPWQVTPSEAQRIALALNLKITSFDVGSSGVSFPMLLKICQDWGELAREQKILLCAVNAPTLYIDYGKNAAAGLFSDAAVTMVLGKERRGFELLALELKSEKLNDSGLSFSPFKGCSSNSEFFTHAAHDCIASSLPTIMPAIAPAKQVTVCVNDYGCDVEAILQAVNCQQAVKVMDTFARYGDSLGCVAGIGMWEWSKTSQAGDVYIGFAPGCGQQHGAFAVRMI